MISAGLKYALKSRMRPAANNFQRAISLLNGSTISLRSSHGASQVRAVCRPFSSTPRPPDNFRPTRDEYADLKNKSLTAGEREEVSGHRSLPSSNPATMQSPSNVTTPLTFPLNFPLPSPVLVKTRPQRNRLDGPPHHRPNHFPHDRNPQLVRTTKEGPSQPRLR